MHFLSMSQDRESSLILKIQISFLTSKDIKMECSFLVLSHKPTFKILSKVSVLILKIRRRGLIHSNQPNYQSKRVSKEVWRLISKIYHQQSLFVLWKFYLHKWTCQKVRLQFKLWACMTISTHIIWSRAVSLNPLRVLTHSDKEDLDQCFKQGIVLTRISMLSRKSGSIFLFTKTSRLTKCIRRYRLCRNLITKI